MKLQEDRVCEFLDACWNAGIKNPTAFLISKRPQVYDWLKGVFPRGIVPTDIDGEVEINGHFLRLEFKDESALRNGAVAKGQLIALKRLTNTKFFTVFMIGTDIQGEPTCAQIFMPGGDIRPLEETTKADLVTKFKKWAEWAESRK